MDDRFAVMGRGDRTARGTHVGSGRRLGGDVAELGIVDRVGSSATYVRINYPRRAPDRG